MSTSTMRSPGRDACHAVICSRSMYCSRRSWKQIRMTL
jgi:hypothetical protein